MDRRDQLAALRGVARHLRPEGVFALDLHHPTPAWVGQAEGTMRQDLHQPTPDGGVVSRVETVVRTNLVSQVRTIRSTYDAVAPDGSVRRRTVEWPFRFTYRFEAEHLLERAGFAVEGVFGGYRGEPLTDSSRTMLFLARRAG